MSRSISESFMLGFQGGKDIARQNRQDSATSRASALLAGGDTGGAESALLGAGMFAEAGAVGDLGERQRERGTRDTIRQRLLTLGPTATTRQRAEAARDVHMESGDAERGLDYEARIADMDADTRERERAAAEWFGGQLHALTGVPQAERQQRLQAAVAASPYAQDLGQQVSGITTFDDQSITRMRDATLTLEQRLAREDAERDRTEDTRRWNADFGAQERHRAWERTRSEEIPFPSAAAERQRFESTMRDFEEARRGADSVEAFARDARSNNGRPRETDSRTVRTQDGILLMTVARMAQGAGILSDQDLSTVRGNGLDAAVNDAVGYLNGGGSLNDRQRLALSDILIRRMGMIDQAMWDHYDSSVDFANRRRVDPASLGYRPPRGERPRREGAPGATTTNRPTITPEREAEQRALDDAALQRWGQPTSTSRTAQGGLRIGHVEEGQEYIGGPPGDPASWRPARQQRSSAGSAEDRARSMIRSAGGSSTVM